MKKKVLSLVLIGAMVASLAACGGNKQGGGEAAPAGSAGGEAAATGEAIGNPKAETDISGATIEITYNKPDTADQFYAMVEAWAQVNGVTIKQASYGADHENQMKTRMGSGSMPDIWETHGWSINRYGEYCTDLSDQPWVADIDPGLKEVVTTDDGQIYILPVTQTFASITYNKSVLEEAGVDPSTIRTWDDFNAACQTILDKTGKQPLAISLDENSLDSYLLELTLPSFYSNEDSPSNALAKLYKSGDSSFDFTKDSDDIFALITKWVDSGYYNKDYVSCKRDDVYTMMANGDSAFVFYEACIPSIMAKNPDAKLGILPVPSVAADGKSYFGIGEGNFGCFAVWKDTKYPEACKELLKYFAQPEVAEKICEWDGGIPALTTYTMPEDVDSATTAALYKEAQEMFKDDLCYDNFFDREYMPSGMWPIMQNAIKELMTDGDPAGHTAAAQKLLQDSWVELCSQAQ